MTLLSEAHLAKPPVDRHSPQARRAVTTARCRSSSSPCRSAHLQVRRALASASRAVSGCPPTLPAAGPGCAVSPCHRAYSSWSQAALRDGDTRAVVDSSGWGARIELSAALATSAKRLKARGRSRAGDQGVRHLGERLRQRIAASGEGAGHPALRRRARLPAATSRRADHGVHRRRRFPSTRRAWHPELVGPLPPCANAPAVYDPVARSSYRRRARFGGRGLAPSTPVTACHPQPLLVSYRRWRCSPGEPVIIDCPTPAQVTVDKPRAAAHPRNVALFINSPSNLTEPCTPGRSSSPWRGARAKTSDHLDEIYDRLLYDGASSPASRRCPACAAPAGQRGLVIILHDRLADRLRVRPRARAKAMKTLQSHMTRTPAPPPSRPPRRVVAVRRRAHGAPGPHSKASAAPRPASSTWVGSPAWRPGRFSRSWSMSDSLGTGASGTRQG